MLKNTKISLLCQQIETISSVFGSMHITPLISQVIRLSKLSDQQFTVH